MGGIQKKGLPEGFSGPGELLPGQPGITQPYVQLHSIRIEREALSKHLEGPVQIPIIIEPMRPFVVFLGAEETIFLHTRLLPEGF